MVQARAARRADHGPRVLIASRGLAMLCAAAGTIVTVGACGNSGGSSSPSRADAETSPRASTANPRASASLVALSADHGVTAVLRKTGRGRALELLVGHGTRLAPAAGVAPLQDGVYSHPRVHVGTDHRGGAVVVYPRCTRYESLRQDCDLYRYDVATAHEALIGGIRRTGQDNYEGVMSGGSLAIASRRAPNSGRRQSQGLFVISPRGEVHRVAHNGGSDLVVSGDALAHVISDGQKDFGEEPCDNSTLVFRPQSGAPRAIARMCELFGPSADWLSPSLYRGQLYWARNGRKTSHLFRYDPSARTIAEARVPGKLFAFQTTGRASGLALMKTDPDPERYEATAVVSLDSIRWRTRARTMLRPVPVLDPHPLD